MLVIKMMRMKSETRHLAPLSSRMPMSADDSDWFEEIKAERSREGPQPGEPGVSSSAKKSGSRAGPLLLPLGLEKNKKRGRSST